MHAEELWTGTSLKAAALRAILTPASWLYALGWQTYLGVYTLGFKKPKAPHSPVICIGNLLVGGTGKTPVSLHVAGALVDLGHEVVISCSGYGSAASEAARVAPPGPLRTSEWGDEAALLRWRRPNIPLIVGRRRVLAAELCNQHYPGAVLLMDDGFQHLPLKKDVTIILDPPQQNHRCMPAGPYREPPSNRRRADVVIQGEFRIETKATTFETAAGEPKKVSGSVNVLCALGRPQGFLDGLQRQGLKLKTVRTLPDHDPLSDGNLLSELRDAPIIVTGKDWVKLRERPDVEQFDIVIASHEVAIEPNDEFRKWLQVRLNGISHKED